MPAPLRRAVEAYLAKRRARFHMPGHKGRLPEPFRRAARYDITEVEGADSLYEASAAIAETEARYAALYGTAGSFLSAGGSTLCIQTMLALAAPPGSKILCGRGVHTAAVNAMALLDHHPEWIWPEPDCATALARPVTANQVAHALARHPDAAAVYLTSPNYFGTLCDIAAISKLCRAAGVPLLVDNAHGAHLRFLEPDLHPITQGADLCCDSLHKTLPVLTGGALLHVGNPRFAADAKRRMSLFGSTSPSYLILLSIDGALDLLEAERQEADFRLSLRQTTERIAALEQLALRHGFLLPPGPREPARLSLGFAPLGLTARDFRAHLSRCGVEPEYLSEAFCVFLAGENRPGDYRRLEKVITSAPRRPFQLGDPPPAPVPPQAVLSLREAVFAPRVEMSVQQAAGHICAGAVSPCPPGVPLALPGERFDNFLCAALKKSGISTVFVVK